jgi:hypothetical protein
MNDAPSPSENVLYLLHELEMAVERSRRSLSQVDRETVERRLMHLWLNLDASQRAH